MDDVEKKRLTVANGIILGYHRSPSGPINTNLEQKFSASCSAQSRYLMGGKVAATFDKGWFIGPLYGPACSRSTVKHFHVRFTCKHSFKFSSLCWPIMNGFHLFFCKTVLVGGHFPPDGRLKRSQTPVATIPTLLKEGEKGIRSSSSKPIYPFTVRWTRKCLEMGLNWVHRIGSDGYRVEPLCIWIHTFESIPSNPSAKWV